MITRASILIAITGIVLLIIGMNENLVILSMIGIGVLIAGVVGIGVGINNKRQSGNRFMYFGLALIIGIVLLMGLLNVF